MVHCKNWTETQMEKIEGSLGDEKYDFIFLKNKEAINSRRSDLLL